MATEKPDFPLAGDRATQQLPPVGEHTIEKKVNPFLPVIVSSISAFAAVIAASVAIFQAVNASKSSGVAVQAALTSQRLGSCISMNQSLETAGTQASWADLLNKPYRKNPRFLAVTLAVHTAGEEAHIFRQMTPGNASDKLLTSIFELRVKLKDMVADGGDYLKQNEIRESIQNLSREQRALCDRLIAPPGGY